MRGKVFALIAFVAVIIGVFAGVGYEFGKIETTVYETEPVQSIVTSENLQGLNKELFDRMASETKAEFAYPVSELMMKYEFKTDVQEPLRIFVGDLNEYRFYCLNQVLIENEVEYAYYRTGDTIQLIIFLNDQEKQKKVLKDFSYYEIKYEIQEGKTKFETPTRS